MEPPDVSRLRTEIAVLEGILREKKEQLRIAEAIEKQKDDLWRKHVAEINARWGQTPMWSTFCQLSITNAE